MYLPALPAIGRSLGASTGGVQLSLVAFLVTMGFGQLVCGPLSDMVGRKRPLYAGLVVFVIASIGCGFSPNIGSLVANDSGVGVGVGVGAGVGVGGRSLACQRFPSFRGEGVDSLTNPPRAA
jgi:MFS transporter, DHA1 family, multidrug resistance protein